MSSNARLFLLHAEELDRYSVKAAEPERRPYQVSETGTAIVSLVGPMQKYGDLFMDMFGGVSSEEARFSVATAAADPNVDGIFLRIDSPGGEVAGTEELADAVRAANRQKPVHAHIEDLGASAAYWVASQADTITANKSAAVGSIGAVVMMPDTTAAWDEAGIKWHVVSSGKYKGLLHGTEVGEDQLAYMQERIDDLAGQFVAAIRRGRRFTTEQVAELREGKVYSAEQAVGLGLIDRVMGRDAAFGALEKRTGDRRAARVAAARQRGVKRAAALGQAYRNIKASE